MKKILLLTFLIFASVPFINAQKDTKPILITIKSNQPKPGNHRAPVHISLNLYFDYSTGSVVIDSSDAMAAHVTIMYENEIVGECTNIPSIIPLTNISEGEYYITIISDYWEADGILII